MTIREQLGLIGIIPVVVMVFSGPDSFYLLPPPFSLLRTKDSI